MKKLQARTAVVTGAASGIGRATAYALASQGAHLALIDVNSTGLSETKTHIESSYPSVKVRIYIVNVGDEKAMKDLAATVVADFGAVHVLVNNAGINVTARFEEHSLEDFKKTFDVNIWGVVHGCRLFLPHLQAAEEGHIVNISSAFGIVGVARQSAYSASKFAVRGLSESLNEELADSSVGVSVVHPGCIKTNIVNDAEIYDTEAAGEIRAYFEKHGCSPEIVANRIVRAIKHNQHRVLITPETYLFDWMRRLLPTTGNRIINRLMNGKLGINLK